MSVFACLHDRAVATPYKNITIDGSLSDWSADELVCSDGTCKFYLTWNATHFTAAWEGVDLAAGDVYIAFDEEPGTSSGVSAVYGGASFSGAQLPEFAIWVKSGMDPVVYQPHKADNSGWDAVQNVNWEKYGGWSDVKVTELSIPRSYLGLAGDPSKPFGVWMWTTTQPGTGDISVTATFPSSNPKGANVQFSACKVYSSSGDGVSPGDSTNPSIISSAASQITNRSATLTVVTSEDCRLSLEYGNSTLYGQILSNATLATTHVFALTGLSEGTTYHYRINATDGAGNFNMSCDYTFSTLGGISIVVSCPTAGQTITARHTTITATASPVAPATVSAVIASIDGTEHAMALSGSEWTYEWSDYADGAHTINVKATDSNGASSEVTVSVTVALAANHGPSLLGTKVEPASGDVLTSFAFVCDYIDEDGDAPEKIVVVIDGVEYAMNTTDTDYVNGAHYTYTTKLTKGDHAFKFVCDDGAGSKDSVYESGEYNVKVKASELQKITDERAEFCQSVSLCYVVPLLLFIGCAIAIETVMPKTVEKLPFLKRFVGKKK